MSKTKQKQPLLDFIVNLFVLLLPISLTLFPKGGVMVIFMLLVSFVGLLLYKNVVEMHTWEKRFLAVFSLYFFIVGWSVWNVDGSLSDLDTPSRLVMVLPIFLFLRKASFSAKWLIYGIIIAAFILGLIQIMFSLEYVKDYPFYHHSGIMALYASILGFTCLFLIGRNAKQLNIALFLAACLTITSLLLLGGRGVWVAAAITMLVILLINPMKWPRWIRYVSPLFAIGIFAISYSVPQTKVKCHIDAAVKNVSAWVYSGEVGTSAGNRLEMWKASLLIVQQHPLIGVGEGKFQEAQKLLISEGKIDNFVGRYQHPHGEYLSSFVEQGILGFLSFLLVLVVPFMYFLRISKQRLLERDGALLSVFGMVVVLHYMGYSFTSGVFDHQSTTLFYATFISIVFGLIKSNIQKL